MRCKQDWPAGHSGFLSLKDFGERCLKHVFLGTPAASQAGQNTREATHAVWFGKIDITSQLPRMRNGDSSAPIVGFGIFYCLVLNSLVNKQRAGGFSVVEASTQKTKNEVRNRLKIV